LQTTFVIEQALADMTEAEKGSLKYNALQAMLVKLNAVSGSTAVTTDDIERTELSTSSTRRSNTVYFSVFFNVATVTNARATTAAATITSSSTLVVSYVKTDGSTVSATSSSSQARAGTASPTPAPSAAPTTAAESESSSRDQTGIIVAAVLVPILVIGLVLAAVYWKVQQGQDERRAPPSAGKNYEASEPRPVQVGQTRTAGDARRLSHISDV
jgi:cobalamin biosynthesis Mg chelatase CobN